MGNHRSGRRPKSTNLKLLAGNPGKRRLNPNEPKLPPPEKGFEEVPAELTGQAAAVAEWERLVPMLRASRMVSDAERCLVIALCQQWGQYVEAQAQVVKRGLVVVGKQGPMVNPFLKVAKDAFNACCRLWVEIGISPSSRSRISALPQVQKPKESKWAGLLA